MMYADIILPIPLQKLYTYEVPQSMADFVRRGCRVLVQFGKKKYYAGIVMRLHEDKPIYETKAICEVADIQPIVRDSQIALWQWIADYYICSLGEVMKAAMPQGLKLESESRLMYNALFEQTENLTPRQQKVLSFVREKKTCTISDVGSHLGGINPISHIKALIEMEALFISEELRDSYKPKLVSVYCMSRGLRSEDDVLECLDLLEHKAPRQAESLMAFLQAAGGMGRATEGVRLTMETLRNSPHVSIPAINELVKKEILSLQKIEVSRLKEHDEKLIPPNELSEKQTIALKEIKRQGSDGRPVLLHGVTGSGKTEIYIHLIEECLQRGGNVLYLLPEIALTTQITQRLHRHFGNQMVVYHSKFSDAERVEVWKKMLSPAHPRIVLGVRSSVLLPLPRLDLIIVDEEHEGSFKQYDPAPRYNARDMAIVLALQTNAARQKEGKEGSCRVVLGSATPSLESWNNAKSGKYGLVSLEQRHAGMELPEVEVVDMTEARHKKTVSYMFSHRLIETMRKALERKEQVILFQNRRGFAPVVECKNCAWIPKCNACDVSMTYHKQTNQLVCHYCGNATTMPQVCPACGTPSLQPQGYGTEKIEEACKELFPHNSITRMDLDTARSRKSFEEIIGRFAERKYDILIGTQMVTKGLDFEGVSTVGIMNADALLNRPDFRADERGYQLMAQVSGRAGRKGRRGQVLIQTSNPSHPVVECVKENAYAQNAARLLEEREAYRFPPFYRMISLTVKHKDYVQSVDAADELCLRLRNKFGNIVSPPVIPTVGKVSNFYLQDIIIKMPKSASPTQVKKMMTDEINALLSDSRYKGTQVRIDVDPY